MSWIIISNNSASQKISSTSTFVSTSAEILEGKERSLIIQFQQHMKYLLSTG